MLSPNPTDDRTTRADESVPWRVLILLMAVTGTGAMATNILVPAVPGLSQSLNSNPAVVQYTISLFILGLGTAQLILGPLSDRIGRRRVMLGGLTLFLVASTLAIFTTSIEELIVVRIFQAFGAATGVVVGRAIIRDLVGRNQTASLLSLVTTAMVVSPMVAPAIGGILDTNFGWHSIFIFVAVAAAILLTWVIIVLPETAKTVNQPGGFGLLKTDINILLRNRAFIGYALTGALSCGPYYVFIGGVPHFAVSILGLSSAEYGLWLILPSFGYMIGNMFCTRLSVRWGIDHVIPLGLSILIGATVLGIIGVWVVPQESRWIIGTLFIANAMMTVGNGMVLPNTIAGAVSIRPSAAGAAAGINGFVQMTLGAGIAQVSSYLVVAIPNAECIAIFSAVTCILSAVFFLTLVWRYRDTGAPIS